MASLAGYNTVVKKSGSSTAMTDEAMSGSGAGPYTIDAAAKKIWDRDTLATFEDNSVAIDAGDILTVDYLTGKVTFTGSKTGPITVSGKYMPMAVVAQAHAAAISLGGDLLNDTDFASAQTAPYVNRAAGLRDASVSLTRWEDVAGTFGAILAAGVAIVLEIQPGGSGKYLRGWFLLESENQSGDVSALEQEELTFQLDADDDALKSVSFAT